MRSSFSREDREGQSFAGQFQSILNVARESVPVAVEQVRKSKEKVEDYLPGRESFKLEGEMKIIVQEMVEAECSAVLFTGNPQGQLNEAVLVVGLGLGTGVVEDRVDTTTYYWNKDDKAFYYERQGESPTLEKNFIEEIFSIGEKIQEVFGTYMDIELSTKKGEIFILQARPITTIEEGRDIVLDNSNISESYPGISLPATESFAKVVYYQAFKSCVEILAGRGKTLESLEATFKVMVTAANGRMYYQISNWYSLLKVLPFSKKIITIWQEMLGVNEKQVGFTDKVKATLFTKVKIGFNFGRMMIRTPREMEKLNQYFLEVFPKYKEELVNTKDNMELLKLYKEARDTIGQRWGITLVNDMYAFIYTAIAKKKYGLQIGDVQMIESLKPVKALEKLATTAKVFGMKSEEYMKGRKEYLESYGDRSFEELKLETKTMNSNPEILDQYIANSFGESFSKDEVMENKEVGELELDNLEIKDPYFLARAKKGIYNRELSRMNRTRLFGFVREILLKVGRNLFEAEKIECINDIFWLYLEEIETCCEEGESVKELIASRKLEYGGYKKLPSYGRLVFRNKVINKKVMNLERAKRTEKERVFNGVPSSKGTVSGEAIVIENPSLEIDARGKILIADTTDPGWVFLIKNASGIVTQRGSILSHTAIITRELKKPSVVGVAGIMEIVKTGDRIKINGEEGTVEIINEKDNIERFE